MKTIFSFLALLIPYSFFTQIIVDSPEYEERKKNNTLEGFEIIPDTTNSKTFLKPHIKNNSIQEKSGACQCYVQPDATYTLAMTPNDDGSSSIIPIPFNFCFYGQTYNQLYINNNGNITFENSLATYSSTAFPSPNNKIIAPFWADVDTRAAGQVLYKITPTALYVNWEQVGYYNTQSDKINTFQLIITDGSDPAVENGNIAFCYKDMQWTTGSASDGVNGFGGTPATAGANKGDNIGFFQLAQFNHAGSDFDGALGDADGISWLDNKSFYFNICNSNNVPPIPEGISACDTIKLCEFQDTAKISIKFLSPEFDQSTSITYTTDGLVNVTEVQNTAGNTAQLVLQVISQASQVGDHTITITATDNFSPPGVTTISFTISVTDIPNDLSPVLTPLVGCIPTELSVLNGPYDTYLWDDLSISPTTSVDHSGIFGVTVSRDGCYKRVEDFINIVDPIINLQGSFYICPDLTKTTLFIPDSNSFSSVDWHLNNPTRDTMFINSLSAGSYTISVVDAATSCPKDTTFLISTQPKIVLADYSDVCGLELVMANNTPIPFGSWSLVSGPGNATFASSTSINTTVDVSEYGAYKFRYSETNCQDADTVSLSFLKTPSVSISDAKICEGDTYTLVASSNIDGSLLTWNTGETGGSITISQEGYYIVTGTNFCGSDIDSAYLDVEVCVVEFPNIFTPNTDGTNENFQMLNLSSGFEIFSVQIFNRWGNLMYEYDTSLGSWNGKNDKGEIASPGVYFYKFYGKTIVGEEIEQQGFFHLVKE